MLNFRNSTAFFLILLISLAIADVSYQIPWYTYAIIAVVYSLLLFYGSYYVGSNFFMKVLCEGKDSESQIAISFDDGPAEKYTADILRILKEKNVPAAFFCIGKRIEGNEELVSGIVDGGHLLGNHSFSHHFWFDLFSTGRMLKDVNEMSDKVMSVTGKRPLLFRPPYGVTTPNMRSVMKKGNFTAIGWNIRSLDTVIKEEKKLLDRISRRLKGGSIILLHDTSAVTVKILPALIDEARKQGLEFVKLDKLLNVQAYA